MTEKQAQLASKHARWADYGYVGTARVWVGTCRTCSHVVVTNLEKEAQDSIFAHGLQHEASR